MEKVGMKLKDQGVYGVFGQKKEGKNIIPQIKRENLKYF